MATPSQSLAVLDMTITNTYPENHLLGIPAEIRNKIFLIIAEEHGFNVNGQRIIYNVPKMHNRKHEIFAEMRVCKQMIKEMRPLFFGNNTFAFKTENHGTYNKVVRKAPVNGLPALSYGGFEDSPKFPLCYYMSLPHVEVCKMIRHVRFTLYATVTCDEFGELEFLYRDWAHPVAVLNEIGLVQLESLRVTVPHIPGGRDVDGIDEMIRNEVDHMTLQIPHIEIALPSCGASWVKEAGTWMQKY